MIERREEDANKMHCPFKLNKDNTYDRFCDTNLCMAWYSTGLYENPVTKEKEKWGRCAALR